MIALKINNVALTINEGTTLIEAALSLGIDIPTMCYLKEYKPNSTCMICTVKDRKTKKLLPSCAALAEEGMDIETDSEELTEFRRNTLELLFSEHVGDCVAPCELGCPAHMEIPKMMEQISDGKYADAIKTVKKDIALPAVLGYVCSAPCENACRRSSVDDSARICVLKRSVAIIDMEDGSGYHPEIKPKTGKKIAIIGAGPTGLSAAYYSILEGHAVTIFDRNEKAGGTLRDYVQTSELPVDILDSEIKMIQDMGVEISLKTVIGDQITSSKLLQKFDCVIIATGKIEKDHNTIFDLKTGSKGYQVDKLTLQTEIDGIFSAGDCVSSRGMPVQAVADGKRAAISVHQFLSEGKVTPVKKRARSRLGKLSLEEINEYLKDARPESPNVDSQIERRPAFNDITDLSNVCLQCGCATHDICKLRKYADEYDADTNRYRVNNRVPVKRITDHPYVVYEPGKCIKCGLCIAVTSDLGEEFGLTYIGRGFDVCVSVPYNESLKKGLKETAEKCASVCPTGAIFRKGRM